MDQLVILIQKIDLIHLDKRYRFSLPIVLIISQ
jgi:hypothetical protein